jgi:hypothetical protein
MAIKNRSFTYRKTIKVSQPDMQLALDGKKTCTIRLGTVGVGGDLLDLSDGTRTLRIRVSGIEQKLYRELTDDHAQREGFKDLRELQDDLKKYYGRVDDEQPVTIINFDKA